MSGGGINPKEVEAAAEAFRRIVGHVGTSKAEIHVNSGGFAVWLAATCCLVMLVSSCVFAMWVSREFARYDVQLSELRSKDNTQQAYLNALYRANPSLPKPENAK